MKYFLFNLLCHLLMFVVFTIITLIFYDRNRKRKTKHGFMYFAPLIFSMIAVAYAIMLPLPRILDMKSVLGNKYLSYTGTVESVGALKNTITVDDQTFFINPFSTMPEEGENIRIKYTGYSRYVMSLEASETADYDN